jgi:hypothetical protein
MPISTEDRSSRSERLNPAPYVRIMQLIDEKYPSMFSVLVKLGQTEMNVLDYIKNSLY